MSIFDNARSAVAPGSSATQASPAPRPKVLMSDRSGLNQFLLAKLYPMKRASPGNGWKQSVDKRELSSIDRFTVDDGYEVWAPVTDASFEMSQGWHSPFENTGSDSRAPTLSAMLQSGSLSPGLIAIAESSNMDAAARGVEKAASVAEGRVGITKLNSTQVFQGMPPAKLSMTLHFRALVDPRTEVQAPISMLEQWAVPQYLASDSDLPAFFGPFQSWKTASVASVEQYRCLNSLGVR